jgi:hypothetical protein
MKHYKSLRHTKWEFKYNLVWIPKYRKRVSYEQLRRDPGPILGKLALQKKSEEGKPILCLRAGRKGNGSTSWFTHPNLAGAPWLIKL